MATLEEIIERDMNELREEVIAMIKDVFKKHGNIADNDNNDNDSKEGV